MSTMQAQVVEKLGSLVLQTVPIPTLAKNEILVKVHAVALNPTDWKHRDYVSPPGSGLGCDFAGTVSSVSEGVTNVKVGDRVAGFVHGGKDAGVGSFAEYCKTESDLVWKVPENVAFEEAAALGGVGPHTAVQGLYFRQNLARPSKPSTTGEAFLVWGGSTSVGMYAIQLAKLSGYKVIATASPANFDYLKSLGADAVYNYKDEATPSKIHADYPNLTRALDCIAENGTTALVAASLSPSSSTTKKDASHIVTLLYVTPDQLGDTKNVTSEMSLAYTLLGKPFAMMGMEFPASQEDRSAIAAWCQYVPTIIGSGEFKSNPLWKQEGGLAKINEGLELLKAGKNSAQKLVYSF